MPVALQRDELLRLTGAAKLRALCAEWRALLERTPKGIRLTGMATFGPLMAGIVMRGEMVPPGRTDREWRAILTFTLNTIAIIA